MLCILTSKRVLHIPFTGINHFFSVLTSFLVTNIRNLEKAKKQKKYLKKGVYQHLHATLKTLADTQKLKSDLIRLIGEWLSGRSFYVEIEGESSVLFTSDHGTIQGSVLGPVLYALFCNVNPTFKY